MADALDEMRRPTSSLEADLKTQVQQATRLTEAAEVDAGDLDTVAGRLEARINAMEEGRAKSSKLKALQVSQMRAAAKHKEALALRAELHYIQESLDTEQARMAQSDASRRIETLEVLIRASQKELAFLYRKVKREAVFEEFPSQEWFEGHAQGVAARIMARWLVKKSSGGRIETWRGRMAQELAGWSSPGVPGRTAAAGEEGWRRRRTTRKLRPVEARAYPQGASYHRDLARYDPDVMKDALVDGERVANWEWEGDVQRHQAAAEEARREARRLQEELAARHEAHSRHGKRVSALCIARICERMDERAERDAVGEWRVASRDAQKARMREKTEQLKQDRQSISDAMAVASRIVQLPPAMEAIAEKVAIKAREEVVPRPRLA